MMKRIQMAISEDLLTQIDQVVKAENVSRAAFIRQALEDALRHYKITRLEQQHTIAYLQQPIKPDEFDGWLTEQIWGGEWYAEK